MIDQKKIRNFAIVAHVDHGKSTLADRLLEKTGAVKQREMVAQILDSNPIERERGITIKLAPVRIKYKDYVLNLIDTPGHVDFSYEVSRSLAACEGVVLVVDATKGIQAQTLAHMQLIKERKLDVIPVVNKIDLPTANVEKVKESLVSTFNFKKDEIIEISAKLGLNIDKLINAILDKIRPPDGDLQKSLRCLVFSSFYDIHKGVVVYIRVLDGSINKSQRLQLFFSKAMFEPVEIGIFTPEMKTVDLLSAGEVGYIATGLKDISLARVGDTIHKTDETIIPFPGYKKPKPIVYLSFYPMNPDEFTDLRCSLEKLHLSDSSFTFELHTSQALGKGFLCGFLGLLHADIVRERLEKEFNLGVISSVPTVEYEIKLKNQTSLFLHSPEQFPDSSQIKNIKEPVMWITIWTPKETVGSVMQLCEEKRGAFINLEYLSDLTKLSYTIPLSEMIIDFFDRLKSTTSGFASLDYEFYEMQNVDAVKLEILINKKKVEAFSQIIVRSKAQTFASKIVDKLKTLIPRHQFQIPIQVVIGGKIIARSDVKVYRKNVTAKLYGGDRTRKDKLLEAQKKGKKRMREFGQVQIPQEVFIEAFRIS